MLCRQFPARQWFHPGGQFVERADGLAHALGVIGNQRDRLLSPADAIALPGNIAASGPGEGGVGLVGQKTLLEQKLDNRVVFRCSEENHWALDSESGENRWIGVAGLDLSLAGVLQSDPRLRLLLAQRPGLGDVLEIHRLALDAPRLEDLRQPLDGGIVVGTGALDEG